jgi:hypothetical protein
MLDGDEGWDSCGGEGRVYESAVFAHSLSIGKVSENVVPAHSVIVRVSSSSRGDVVYIQVYEESERRTVRVNLRSRVEENVCMEV